MPIDRDKTLKTAEKFLKQGKTAAAIEEYVRLVEDNPSDWNAANALGDLYVRTGEAERAADQFARAADHLYTEGFLPRASAVYKKVLKVKSDSDHAIWRLADIASRNGLLLDARSYYARLIRDRRAAGNERGAVDCLVRLALLEDANLDAKRVAARALVEHGESRQAAQLILGAAEALLKDGRRSEALELFEEAVALDPKDREILDKRQKASAEDEPTESASLSELIEPLLLESANVTDSSEGPQGNSFRGLESDASLNDDAIVLESTTADTAAVLAEIAAVPTSSAAESLPLETFFEELRTRVARDQTTRAREQMERGLRHLEEQRPADAFANFEEAARDPAVRFEASAHLARICLGRGDLQDAVEWMERALEAPAPALDDRLSLMYDLADTLGQQGERERAMAVFMEIEADGAGYRDVRERIAGLTRPEIGES